MRNGNLEYIIKSIEKLDEIHKYSGIDYLINNDVVVYDIDCDKVYCVSRQEDDLIRQNIEFLFERTCINKCLSDEDFFNVKKLFIEKIDNLEDISINIFKIDENEDLSNLEIIKYLNEMIYKAIVKDATDIHIEPFEDYIRLRFRIDGILQVVDKISKKYLSIIITRIKILGGMDISERRLPQDGRITFKYNDRDIDLRISTVPTIYGEKIAIRILDSYFKFTELESLGLNEEEIYIIENSIQNLNGLILVCGPTNSGKTTTIYSMLNKLNSDEINITTLEDPVEYKIDGINQIQINYKTGLEFLNTLNYLLRQDPEILFIGEIREEATVKTALRAAITGELVISTIHTKDSISTIDRLRDMNAENYLISSGLKLIISQRLVRKLCQECRKKVNTKHPLFDNLEYSYMPVGCSKCNNGYKGRVALFEILKIDDEIKKLINENKSYDEIYKVAKDKGFKNLKEICMEAIEKGTTSIEEIIKII